MSVSIIQIEPNDDLRQVISKSNANFASLSSTSRETSLVSSITSENSENVARQFQTVLTSINEFRSYIQGQLANMELKLQGMQQRIDLLFPAVGTYIMSDYDPTNQYPATEWEKVTPAPLQNIDTWKRIK